MFFISNKFYLIFKRFAGKTGQKKMESSRTFLCPLWISDECPHLHDANVVDWSVPSVFRILMSLIGQFPPFSEF